MSHHLTPADKQNRIYRAAVAGVTQEGNEVKFTLKKPVPLPFETVSPEKSARDLEVLLGTKEGINVTEGKSGYDVVLTGAAKEAFDAINTAVAAKSAVAQNAR